LQVFFTIHDPTTVNRQGADVGPQYRSVIFYHSPEQQQTAKDVMAELSAEHVWRNPIVTELVPYTVFYPAEAYHQDYFNKHPNQPYCAAVIAPKVSKMRKAYFDRLVKA
jgi:peptide-methionine (S)-S-oxide reductase